MTLQQTTDKAGYDLMLETRPALIKAINEVLDKGGTAQQIEATVISKFGRASLAAALVIGAAHYLETQRKQGDPNA